MSKVAKAYLVASGDLRLAANRTCWPAQAELEGRLGATFAAEGVTFERTHPFDETKGHGFIDAQRLGMDVFGRIPLDGPTFGVIPKRVAA